jgi:succinate dehydrogenase/fumarate reductase cytochrome b subunit
MATWRKRSLMSISACILLHFLFLPLLALAWFVNPAKYENHLNNPMIKMASHFCSTLFFVALLIASSIQDKLEDNLGELSTTGMAV